MNKDMRKLLNFIKYSRHCIYTSTLSIQDQSRALELEKMKLIKTYYGSWSGEAYYVMVTN